jgi:hypothetical protein
LRDAGGSPRSTGTNSIFSNPLILLITFSGRDGGELVFVAVEANLDVRYGSRDDAACAGFSWEGFDDGSPTSGRGWAAFGTGAASSDTSSSTKATTEASSPSAGDFFNSLLVV